MVHPCQDLGSMVREMLTQVLLSFRMMSASKVAVTVQHPALDTCEQHLPISALHNVQR